MHLLAWPEKRGKGAEPNALFSSPTLRHHIKYHISFPLGRIREECFRSISRRNRLSDVDLIVDSLWGIVLRVTTS